MENRLNCATLREQKNTKFTVMTENSGEHVLELADVIERNDSPRIESFSVHFLGEITPYLVQSSYRFRHDVLGEFSMFITPLGPHEGRMRYESVFSRLIKDAQ